MIIFQTKNRAFFKFSPIPAESSFLIKNSEDSVSLTMLQSCDLVYRTLFFPTMCCMYIKMLNLQLCRAKIYWGACEVRCKKCGGECQRGMQMRGDCGFEHSHQPSVTGGGDILVHT